MSKGIALRNTGFRNITCLAFSFCLVAFSVVAQEPAPLLRDFLRKHIGFLPADFSALDRGETVVKPLTTAEKSEVAVFGAIRVNITSREFTARLRDIETFKKGPNVLQIGKFSTPPRLEDLAALTLEEEDFQSMRECHVGRCDVKLPAAVIRRLAREINWGARDARTQAAALLRSTLFQYVEAYLKGGNAALMQYEDKKDAVRLEDEFRGLLDNSPYLYEYVPAFHEYLLKYPEKRLPNVENFLYWSKEKFGLKPIVSITHVTIYTGGGTPRALLTASKQIYASHYFEASLGLTAVADGSSADPPGGSYLMYLNRSRADALRGAFSGLKRWIAVGRARDGMKINLHALKLQLEVAGAP